MIGFVKFRNSEEIKSTTLSHLRLMMDNNLERVPNEFTFLTGDGWLVSSRQEATLTVFSVMNESDSNCIVFIRRKYGMLFCNFLNLKIAISNLLNF